MRRLLIFVVLVYTAACAAAFIFFAVQALRDPHPFLDTWEHHAEPASAPTR